VAGCVVFASFIWSRRGVLSPSLIPPRLAWAPMRDILRVGAVSSIVSLSTNVSIATTTGLAGLIGPAAVAGYGTGARLEYLLVPLVFGLGRADGRHGRYLHRRRPSRSGVARRVGPARLLPAVLLKRLVSWQRCFPSAWLSLFGSDPNMIETGSLYLRIVSPTYGFLRRGASRCISPRKVRAAWAGP